MKMPLPVGGSPVAFALVLAAVVPATAHPLKVAASAARMLHPKAWEESTRALPRASGANASAMVRHLREGKTMRGAMSTAWDAVQDLAEAPSLLGQAPFPVGVDETGYKNPSYQFESRGMPLLVECVIGIGAAVLMLAVDRSLQRVRLNAYVQTGIWITIAAGTFSIVYLHSGEQNAKGWMEGYIYEWIFSVDDLFIFHYIFMRYKTPKPLKDKALFWTLVFQLLLRFMYYVEFARVATAHPAIQYGAGFLLLYGGVTSTYEGLSHPDDPDPELEDDLSPISPRVQSPATGATGEGIAQAAPHYTGDLVLDSLRFCLGSRFTETYGLPEGLSGFHLTLLPVVTACMVAVDGFLGADCAVAKISLEKDHVINLTSSAAAVFGVRTAYFIVEHCAETFAYLKGFIGLVLVFVGGQLLLLDYIVVPVGQSLMVMAAILGVGMLMSVCHEPSQVANHKLLEDTPSRCSSGHRDFVGNVHSTTEALDFFEQHGQENTPRTADARANPQGGA